MAYLGNDLQVAFPSYRLIDDISASFNGVLKTFALTIGGASPVPFPINPQQCLISVNGTIQKPDPTGTAGFTLAGTNIVFASAPTGGWAFFGVILAGADYVNIGANFPDGQVSAPSITFDQDTDTGFYRSSSGAISFTSNGVGTATFGSASFTAPSFIPTSSTVPTNGVYLPAANSVAISTNGTGRLFVDSSGEVTTTNRKLNSINLGLGAGSVATNTAVGSFALQGNTTGSSNTAVGNQALLSNSTGFANTAVGQNALYNTSASNNTAIGESVLQTNSTGGFNTSAGVQSMFLNNTGSSNTCYGYQAGYALTTGSNNTIIGNIQGTAGLSNTVIIGAGSTERLRIDSSGRLGLGTSTPAANIDVIGAASGAANNTITGASLRVQSSIAGGENFAIRHRDATNGISGINSCIQLIGQGANALELYTIGAAPLVLGTNTVERARIDSSGRLLVGTSTGTSRLSIAGTADNANSEIQITATGVASGYIGANSNGLNIGTDTAGLVFKTGVTGGGSVGASGTERMRITSSGFAKFSNTATYAFGVGNVWHTFNSDQNYTLLLSNTKSDISGAVFEAGANRVANSGFSLIKLYSDYAAVSPDIEFNLRGDGTGLCDGSWTGGGADYAEYFEWSDSNPSAEDRRGISVVLDGNKIREAVAGEDPIGVISGNPSVVGDAAWNKWSGKYLRDEFSSYLLDENGDRQLNAAYDPDAEYIPREQRPEWDCVGLMGKLRIRKGQVTGSRWIKMRDISDSVEEWLVR